MLARYEYMHVTDEQKADSIFRLINKNKLIPTFMAHASEDELLAKSIESLLEAIKAGDFSSPLFYHPECDLYLFYLLAKKKISFTQGISAYSYLLGLMQFTPFQPLRETENKSIREYSIEFLVKEKQFTKIADDFIDTITKKFAEDIHFALDNDQLRHFILNIPASEQTLLKIAVDDIRLQNESFLHGIIRNIPFCTKQKINDSEYYLIPSFTLLEYFLSIVSDQPFQPLCMPGCMSIQSLTELHKRGQHHTALYSHHVKNNLTRADGYAAGPLVSFIHDIGHCFWGSLLDKIARQCVFDDFVPYLEKLSKEAADVGDFAVVEWLDKARDMAVDLDLTRITSFTSAEHRLKNYINKAIGAAKARFGLYPISGQCEFTKIGHCVEDRIFFLIAKAYYQDTKTPINQLVFNLIDHSSGQHIREDKALEALRKLAQNTIQERAFTAKSRVSLLPPINLEYLRKLLEMEDNSAILSNLFANRYYDLLALITHYEFNVFEPYLPFSNEARQRLKEILSPVTDSFTPMNNNHYHLGKDISIKNYNGENMKVNIIYLNLAKVLTALYENASKNEKYGLDCPRLTEEEAEVILATQSFIDKIGPVVIKIDFKNSDEIDVSEYEYANPPSENIKSATDLIQDLRERMGHESHETMKVWNQRGFTSKSPHKQQLFANTDSISNEIASLKSHVELSKSTKEYTTSPENEIEELISSLLSCKCSVKISSILGISIELPFGTSFAEFQSIEILLKENGIEVSESFYESKISFLKFPAKFCIKEDVRLLQDKIAFALQSKNTLK